jgi:serine/threonine-protein kinase
MSRGGPDVNAIFTAALGLAEGPECDAYLAAACGGDAGLRRRVEDLLAAFARASDVLGPSGVTGSVAVAEAPTQRDARASALEARPTAGPEATGARGYTTEPGKTVSQAPTPVSRDPEAPTSPDYRGERPLNGDGLLPGTAVRYFGDYEIRRELGRGGMGVVYEARQVSLNRFVALKMVKAGLLAGDDELRRFQNEAEAVALLDHSGIVPVYEVGEHDGQRYFSMKLVSGGSLVPLLERFKGDPKAAARLVAEAAEAVAHAHARGILHRDLKPANILVDHEGHPHVTDFGLAKKVHADVEFTVSGAILGTPAYMAPEQATGRRGSITTATDVYGLGAVLYALLTGRAPFGGDSVVETLDAVRNMQPEPPSKLAAGLPRDLETICLKCLEKDPRRRYATAQALADDLRAWLERRPIAARRVGVAERAWLWCKRRPAVAALSAAVALAIVGGTAAVIAVQAKANAELRAANRRVQVRYELAADAIKAFHTGVSEDFLLKQDQFKELRDRLLKSAADFYGKLGALLGAERDLASRRTLAVSNFELAVLTDKVGRKEEALAAHRAVLAARESLAAEPGADAAMKADVGRSLTAVAGLLEGTGKTEAALAAFRRSESLLIDLAAADPSARAALAACRSGLGRLLALMDKMDDALAAHELARADREALAAAPGASNDARRDLASTIQSTSNVLREMGKLSEAEAESRKAVAIWQKLADENPAVTGFLSSLTLSHQNLGILLGQVGKPSEAEAEYRRAIATFQRLVGENPAVTHLRYWLAASHATLGKLLMDTGTVSEAEAEIRQGIVLYRKLLDDNPVDIDFRRDLAFSHNSLGCLLLQSGRLAEAGIAFREAVAIYRKMADESPNVPYHRYAAANNENNLSVVLRRAGHPVQARDHGERAAAVSEALVREHPGATIFRVGLAGNLLNRGQARRAIGDSAGASADLRRALALYNGLEWRSSEGWFSFACSRAALAGLAGRPGSGVSAAEAASQADAAMALLREAVGRGYRSRAPYRDEDALDPLRNREDFRLLMMDLAMPTEPFAAAH